MLLYDGFHKIEKIEIDGVIREKLILKSAVSALVLDEYEKIALVKQFRQTIGRETWEIPAGVLDKDISPLETMLEELQEECEIDLSKVTSVKEESKYYMITGSSDATMTIYSVLYNGTGISKTVEDADVTEVKWVSLSEAFEMIGSREIIDPKTIIAVSYVSVKID